MAAFSYSFDLRDRKTLFHALEADFASFCTDDDSGVTAGA